MSKSLLGLHHAIKKAKPLYRTAKKLAGWYQDHPVTPHETAEKVQVLHDQWELETKDMDARHELELKVKLDHVAIIKAEAIALGKIHQQEKENIAMGYAKTELDLLEGRITDIPEKVQAIQVKPVWYVVLAEWLLGLIHKPWKTDSKTK